MMIETIGLVTRCHATRSGGKDAVCEHSSAARSKLPCLPLGDSYVFPRTCRSTPSRVIASKHARI